MYGWPERCNHHRTFQLIRRVAPLQDTPWLCMGDFNEILWSWEKRGGIYQRTRSMEEFWDTISQMGLQDLGFSGNKFTWSNGRAGEANIMVRHDRALANPSWRVLCENSRVLHLPRTNSDHSPILILWDHHGGQIRGRSNRNRLFQFEKIWMENEMCVSVVETG
ncbi:hypothetical protein ACS0TY_030494 [Phlomoides rotata]